MIKISKGKEPKEWEKYRNTPGVSYHAIPELVGSLLQEQGYICAYCMRRIPCRDNGISEDHHIEHILSRDKHPKLELNYNNMVICCPGSIGVEAHCDRKKDNCDITFDLFDADFIATLSYESDGKIVSSHPVYNKEINEKLNLNTPLLKANRKESWRAVVKELVSRRGNKAWDRPTLLKYLQKYSSKQNKDGKLQYIPYCGIVVYNLQKKLKQLP